MIVIKSFNKPEDVYILGTIAEDADFSITDDESELTIKTSDETKVFRSITTDGFVTILTKPQILVHLDDLKDSFEDDDFFEGVVLKGFVGDIKLQIINEENVDVTEEFDIKADYIQHQGDYDYVDIELVLPKDTEIKIVTIAEILETL